VKGEGWAAWEMKKLARFGMSARAASENIFFHYLVLSLVSNFVEIPTSFI
jgi:hypothetical protein